MSITKRKNGKEGRKNIWGGAKIICLRKAFTSILDDPLVAGARHNAHKVQLDHRRAPDQKEGGR